MEGFWMYYLFNRIAQLPILTSPKVLERWKEDVQMYRILHESWGFKSRSRLTPATQVVKYVVYLTWMNLPWVNIYLTKQRMKYSTPPVLRYSRRFTFHWTRWTVHHCSWNVVLYTWLAFTTWNVSVLENSIVPAALSSPDCLPSLKRWPEGKCCVRFPNFIWPTNPAFSWHNTQVKKQEAALYSPVWLFLTKDDSASIWATWFQKSCVILGFGTPWPCGKKCKTRWTRPP